MMKRVVSLLCMFVMLGGYLQASDADDYGLLVSTLYKKYICQCAVQQLAPLAHAATAQDVPLIQKILSELEIKQKPFVQPGDQGRHDWNTLFDETLHAYSYTAAVTRGDRPDETDDQTGTSSQQPAINPAIASAVQLVIECINNQGSWSVERLLVRDKAVISHLIVSHATDVSSLHVTGDLTVDGNTMLHDSAIEGDLCVQGDIVATGSITGQGICPSDKRIKTNVHTLDQQKSFDVIKRLRPISYTYTPEFVKRAHVQNNNIQLGLIAQEVEELVPEVVSPLSIGGQEIRGISYDRLVPYLIGSIQALANELKELKQRKST